MWWGDWFGEYNGAWFGAEAELEPSPMGGGILHALPRIDDLFPSPQQPWHTAPVWNAVLMAGSGLR